MKLVAVRVKNLRCYASDTGEIPIDAFTTLIGKNDAGKSTLLHALDVFLADGSLDNDDSSIGTASDEIEIRCIFEDLPDNVVGRRAT